MYLLTVLHRNPDVDGNAFNQIGREVKGRNHTYYQVLIDSRDCPHIVCILFSFIYVFFLTKCTIIIIFF